MVSKLRQAPGFGLVANMALLLSLLVIMCTPLSAGRAQDALQAAEEVWVLTSDNCKVGGTDQSFISVDWSGECVNGFAQGYGTQTWRLSDTDQFVWNGHMERGLGEGQGRGTTLRNGEIYSTSTGVWRNDEFYQGTIRREDINGGSTEIEVSEFEAVSIIFYQPSGDVFIYRMVANGFDESQATIFFANGDSYVGELLNGERSGFGTYTWSEGGSHEGNWLLNKRHGFGTSYDLSGQIIQQGVWANDVFSRSAAGSESSRFPVLNSRPEASAGSTFATCAENGSCYGDLSTYNGLPKTIHVEGYYRSDGTYVRGHYRSNGN